MMAEKAVFFSGNRGVTFHAVLVFAEKPRNAGIDKQAQGPGLGGDNNDELVFNGFGVAALWHPKYIPFPDSGGAAQGAVFRR